MLLTFFVLRHRLKGLLTNFSKKLVRPLISAAWPIALSGILGGLMLNTDVVVLGWFRSADEVGFYAAAQRIIQLVYVIPIVLAVSAFPIFSRLARRDDAQAKAILERVLSLYILLALPLALGGLILNRPIMELVFGSEYLPSALSFGLLSLTFILTFPSIIFSNTIFAYGQQRKLIIFAAIGGLANVVLDLAFIPTWGMVGSAWATIISQALALAYLYRAMKAALHFELASHLKKIALALGVMALVVLGMNFALTAHVLWTIGFSAAAYFIILWVLKEPVLKEVKSAVFGETDYNCL